MPHYNILVTIGLIAASHVLVGGAKLISRIRDKRNSFRRPLRRR